jgi:thioredoxin 2
VTRIIENGADQKMNGEKIIIACAHCDALNRLPVDRLAENPHCGVCKERIFQASPVNVGASNFAAHVQRSELPVLIDFWAPWCGPCVQMAPAFAQAAAILEPTMRLVKIDTEAEPELGGRFNIRSIPTLAMFKGGREMARQSGSISQQQIVQWARSHAS